MDMEHHEDGTTTVKANVGKDYKYIPDHKRAQMLSAAMLFDERIRLLAADIFEDFLDDDEEDDVPDDLYAELATEFAGFVLKMVARTVSELVGPLVDDMKAEIPSGGGVVTIGWQESTS